MYIAPADATLGEAEWRPFVETTGFGHLAAAGRERDVPVVVPTQFVLEGDTVRLHLVRTNPLFSALAENRRVLLSVAGDWAFIPSNWKAVDGEDPRLGIPTTYYASVQLVGDARIVADPAGVAEVLRLQLAALQPDVDVADPAEHGPKLGAITAMRIAVRGVRSKFKYGGNVDAAHRRAVGARLEARSGPGDGAARTHLLRRLDG
jgi:transcriptional regulator